jgi:hypothetical protein
MIVEALPDGSRKITEMVASRHFCKDRDAEPKLVADLAVGLAEKLGATLARVWEDTQAGGWFAEYTAPDPLAGTKHVMALTVTFESLFAKYIEKLVRLDELKAAGRYGYQLKMPRLALHKAAEALRRFCKVNDIVSPVP